MQRKYYLHGGGNWHLRDNGEAVYTPTQFENMRKFYEEDLPNANRVEGPEEKIKKKVGGVIKAQNGVNHLERPTKII